MTHRVFSQEELKQRAIRRAAVVLFELWEEGQGANTRLLDWLVPSSYVDVGISTQGGGWREHVVPLAFIRDQCFEIFDANGTVDQAADFIARHLKAVHITREERRKIDFKKGLKSRMPTDWTPGDYLARLDAAGITIEEYKSEGSTTKAD